MLKVTKSLVHTRENQHTYKQKVIISNFGNKRESMSLVCIYDCACFVWKCVSLFIHETLTINLIPLPCVTL